MNKWLVLAGAAVAAYFLVLKRGGAPAPTRYNNPQPSGYAPPAPAPTSTDSAKWGFLSELAKGGFALGGQIVDAVKESPDKEQTPEARADTDPAKLFA